MLEVHDSMGPNPIGTTNFKNPGVDQLAEKEQINLNAAVAKLARRTELKIPHEDTLWARIPPAVPTSTNGNVAQLAAGDTFRACSVWVRVPPFLQFSHLKTTPFVLAVGHPNNV